MKYVLVVLVVGVVLWLLLRQRGRARDGGRGPEGTKGKPAPMLACAHCGIHLPADDAVKDAAGQVYCSEAHRLAGPR